MLNFKATSTERFAANGFAMLMCGKALPFRQLYARITVRLRLADPCEAQPRDLKIESDWKGRAFPHIEAAKPLESFWSFYCSRLTAHC